MTLLGLKTITGHSEESYIRVLGKTLEKKLMTFPNQNFNSYYDYSLGLIALHVGGRKIPDRFANRLLKGLFVGDKNREKWNEMKMKNDGTYLTDTEGMALLVLKAIATQKFVPHKIRKRTVTTMRKMKTKVRNMLKNRNIDMDLRTQLHLLQVKVISICTKTSISGQKFIKMIPINEYK